MFDKTFTFTEEEQEFLFRICKRAKRLSELNIAPSYIQKEDSKEKELREMQNESIINQMRAKEIIKRQQNIFLCLYELKKELNYLSYRSNNYYPSEFEKICIKNAYEYVSNKFPEFQIPQEAVEFYV